ncbi:MAG: tetratricopeptide repeat protein [Anaerolineae bacterium]|nr:tetratricopeptide repeat protein [Anaerolineae bacterium]
MSERELKAQLQEAITLAQAGQRAEARALFESIVAADPRQELAWLWLATVTTNQQERITFLERVLQLNPGNSTAQEAYAKLTGRMYTPGPAPSRRERSPAASFLGSLLVILAFVFVAVAVVLIARELRDDPESTVQPVFDEPLVLPTLAYTSTPAFTPRPTHTPGPSPTPPTLPPTWTSEPSPAPVQRTVPPTFTPRPTLTGTATLLPTLTGTPQGQDLTAQFAQTSDAPRTATPNSE